MSCFKELNKNLVVYEIRLKVLYSVKTENVKKCHRMMQRGYHEPY